MTNMPRWTNPDNLTPIERQVYNAFAVVEGAGSHQLLTNASVALSHVVRTLVEWTDAGMPGAASVDTHPKGEDVEQASFMGSAVPKADAQKPIP